MISLELDLGKEAWLCTKCMAVLSGEECKTIDANHARMKLELAR